MYSLLFQFQSFILLHSLHPLCSCALCVFVEWGWTLDRGRPVGAGKAYGWGQAQQCSMFYNTPCVQHSWAEMFSVTQEELFPMAIWMKHWGPELISIFLLFIFELVVNKNRSTFYSLLFRQGESNSALCFACPMFFIKDNRR